jgi:hypothetical protein
MTAEQVHRQQRRRMPALAPQQQAEEYERDQRLRQQRLHAHAVRRIAQRQHGHAKGDDVVEAGEPIYAMAGAARDRQYLARQEERGDPGHDVNAEQPLPR